MATDIPALDFKLLLDNIAHEMDLAKAQWLKKNEKLEKDSPIDYASAAISALHENLRATIDFLNKTAMQKLASLSSIKTTIETNLKLLDSANTWVPHVVDPLTQHWGNEFNKTLHQIITHPNPFSSITGGSFFKISVFEDMHKELSARLKAYKLKTDFETNGKILTEVDNKQNNCGAMTARAVQITSRLQTALEKKNDTQELYSQEKEKLIQLQRECRALELTNEEHLAQLTKANEDFKQDGKKPSHLWVTVAELDRHNFFPDAKYAGAHYSNKKATIAKTPMNPALISTIEQSYEKAIKAEADLKIAFLEPLKANLATAEEALKKFESKYENFEKRIQALTTYLRDLDVIMESVNANVPTNKLALDTILADVKLEPKSLTDINSAYSQYYAAVNGTKTTQSSRLNPAAVSPSHWSITGLFSLFVSQPQENAAPNKPDEKLIATAHNQFTTVFSRELQIYREAKVVERDTLVTKKFIKDTEAAQALAERERAAATAAAIRKEAEKVKAIAEFGTAKTALETALQNSINKSSWWDWFTFKNNPHNKAYNDTTTLLQYLRSGGDDDALMTKLSNTLPELSAPISKYKETKFSAPHTSVLKANLKRVIEECNQKTSFWGFLGFGIGQPYNAIKPHLDKILALLARNDGFLKKELNDITEKMEPALPKNSANELITQLMMSIIDYASILPAEESAEPIAYLAAAPKRTTNATIASFVPTTAMAHTHLVQPAAPLATTAPTTAIPNDDVLLPNVPMPPTQPLKH